MRVLLMSMPDATPHFWPRRWRPPNVAITSIAGNTPNHEVHTADMILKRESVPETVTELIEEYRPHVVGLSAMTFQFGAAQKMAEFIKKLDASIHTVLGGYHATLMYDEICKSDQGAPFDYIIRGEGDLSFGELLEAIEEKRDFEEVDGLSFRKNGKFIHNRPRPLEDLSKIKLPDRTKRIWKGYSYYGSALDVMETSRGCTMPCNFCSMDQMYGKSFRTYEIERVLKDIENIKKAGGGWVIVSDDNFTLDVPRFEGLCDAIVEAGHNDLRYIVQASSIGISSSETLAKKMAAAGFKIVFLGIENVSADNLKQMKKGNIIEKTHQAVKLLHNNDILIVGGMILGLPNDNEETIARNYEFFKELEIDFVADQIVTPYPKTGMREDMLNLGLITNLDDYRWYDTFWANVKTNHLSPDDIQFQRWRNSKQASEITCTTPVFVRNFPWFYRYRKYIRRPYYKLVNKIRNRGMSERDLYERDVARARKLNELF